MVITVTVAFPFGYNRLSIVTVTSLVNSSCLFSVALTVSFSCTAVLYSYKTVHFGCKVCRLRHSCVSAAVVSSESTSARLNCSETSCAEYSRLRHCSSSKSVLSHKCTTVRLPAPCTAGYDTSETPATVITHCPETKVFRPLWGGRACSRCTHQFSSTVAAEQAMIYLFYVD